MKIDILFKDIGSLALQKNAQVFYELKKIIRLTFFHFLLYVIFYQKSMLLIVYRLAIGIL